MKSEGGWQIWKGLGKDYAYVICKRREETLEDEDGDGNEDDMSGIGNWFVESL